MKTLTIERRAAGVAQVTMSRPEVFNAFDEAMIADLDAALTELAADIHHGKADDIGEGVDLLVPGLFQQLLCRYHPAIGPHQFLEHGKFLA